MSKLHLFRDCDADCDGELNVNKAYANRYDKWRHLEELQKCLFQSLCISTNLDDMRMSGNKIISKFLNSK